MIIMKQKIEFIQLGDTETLIMLNILQINKDRMKCKYCKKKVTYANCSIFPGKEKGDVIIACDSELCISEWMTEMRD